MPQTFQVLRCFKCCIFQVHQIRKDNKWVCKMCNEKQSVKRHYGLGTGKDCRIHVQKLNRLRGEKEETAHTIDSDNSENDESYSNNSATNTANTYSGQNYEIKDSKWTPYIDEQENKTDDEPEYYNDREVALKRPQKRKINTKFKQFKLMKKSVQREQQCEKELYTDNSINETDNYEKIIHEIQKPNETIPEVTYKNNKLETHNLEKTLKPNKPQLQPEKIDKSSRWAQFVDEGDSLLENSNNNYENNVYKNTLFSLCDDNDIDAILDL